MTPVQLIKTLVEIKRRGLLESLHGERNRAGYFIVEGLALDLQCVKEGTEDGQITTQILESVGNIVTSNSLEDEILNSEIYWKVEKQKYIPALINEIIGLIDEIIDNSYDYESKRRTTNNQDVIDVLDFIDKAIMYLKVIKERLPKKLQHLSRNKRVYSKTPQQMLILDKLGIISFLYENGWSISDQSEVLSKLLNQDKSNIKLYLTYGSGNYASKPKNATQAKYLYQQVEIEKKIEEIFNQNDLK